MCRHNIVRACNDLARRLDGVTMSEYAEFTVCLGKVGIPLANYIIDFRASSVNETRDRLRSVVRDARELRAVCLPGDTPIAIEMELLAHGFWPAAQLHAMTYHGSPVEPAVEASAWASAEERPVIASWLASHSFGNLDAADQAAMARATAASPHQLVRCVVEGELIAAAMIVEDAASLGLYNLFVSQPHRGRSWGKRVVGWVVGYAATRQKHVVLQCTDGLVGWYMSQGFESEARITVMEKRVKHRRSPEWGDV